MRLLNVRTLEIALFLNEETRPPYAILSHTWLAEGEEVPFEDLLKYHEAVAQEQPLLAESIASRPGFKKIQRCCDIAAESHGLDWAWIDTCCIDKQSSAELSEAINSMFKWYRDSALCYALLQDVAGSKDDPLFRDSKWFTRGWTLQELIAPKRLLFYNQEWKFIGAMDEDLELCNAVSSITSIPAAFLRGAPLTEACVAKKMSWASKRQTTRPEDVAYSLLGIFGVNMPLLYGEGNKAFIRLQEEIIKQTYDHSILAWGTVNTKSTNVVKPGDLGVRMDSHFVLAWGIVDPDQPGTLNTDDIEEFAALATSPADFADCWDFETASNFFPSHGNVDLQATPAGVRLGVNLYEGPYRSLCELSCFTWRYPSRRIVILLGHGALVRNRLALEGRSQYIRQGRDLWCNLDLPPLWAYVFGWRRHGGRTITIIKDIDFGAMHGVQRRHEDSGQPGSKLILLRFPDNHTFDAEYSDPHFRVETDTHQLGKHHLRILYPPEAPVVGLSLSGWEAVIMGSAVVDFALWAIPFGILFHKNLVAAIVLAFVNLYFGVFLVAAYPLYLRFLVDDVPMLYRRARMLVRGEGAGPRLDRRAVRACVRVAERRPGTAPGDARQVMVVVCYRPQVVVGGKKIVLMKPELTCHLSPVPAGRPGQEDVHPTGLDPWPRAYKRLEVGGKTYVQDIRSLKTPLGKFEGPNLSVNIELKS